MMVLLPLPRLLPGLFRFNYSTVTVARPVSVAATIQTIGSMALARPAPANGEDQNDPDSSCNTLHGMSVMTTCSSYHFSLGYIYH